MQDNVINFEEALEEQDKALDKALKEVSFYQKKYFGCLTENKEIREENKEIKKMNKAMEKIIKKIAEQ